jgi:ABC-2 type transport system ATP-binding protein
MITVTGLTKHYGDRTAVDDLTFTVAAGRVTGFVGPNGAGKSTTMRMMVGLTRPDRGEVRYDGVRYTDLRHPARLVGTVLDPAACTPATPPATTSGPWPPRATSPSPGSTRS